MDRTGNPTAHVAATKEARALARARLGQAAQSLERGKRVATDAQDALAAARNAESDATNAHASRLEAAINAGADHSPPALVFDDRPRRVAESRAAITSKALESLTAHHAQCATDLQAAEDAVVAAARNNLIAEGEALAAEIKAESAKNVRRRERLLGLLGTPFQSQAGPMTLTDSMTEALYVPPTTAESPTYAPTHAPELTLMRGPHLARIAAHSQKWNEALTALIDGEPTTDTATKAA